MNVRLLKAAMVIAGLTTADMLRELGIGKSAWFRKLNGKSQFTQKEICKIRQVLKLTDRQTVEIFFAEKVS